LTLGFSQAACSVIESQVLPGVAVTVAVPQRARRSRDGGLMPGLRLNKGVERYLSIPLLNILGTATHWQAELVTNEALRCCRHRLDFETSQNEVYYKAHFALLPGTADAFTRLASRMIFPLLQLVYYRQTIAGWSSSK
jgi:hypothetical protein